MSHKIKILLNILVLLSGLVSKSQEKKDITILSGVVYNKTEDKIKLTNIQNQLIAEIAISPEGRFLDTLKISEGLYTINYNRVQTNIYLKPQENLKITFDTNNLNETLKFSETGENANNYLKDKQQLTTEIVGSFYEFYKLDREAFKSKNELLKQKLTALLNSKSSIPSSFKSIEERNLNYEFIIRLISYNQGIKEGFFDLKPFLGKIDFNNLSESDFNFSKSYQFILNQHFSKLSSEIVEKENVASELAYINVVSKIKSNLIKDKLLYDAAKSDINYTNQLDLYYNTFLKASSNEKYNKAITELYNKLNKLSPGKMSPIFNDYLNHSEGKSSLTDFKGKYVYIDIWATWCKPCRDEIPYLKELEKKYEGKNIQFVSISIDKASDLDKWKDFVRKNELGGVQLLADNGPESKFIREYHILGIPRFILLNPEGVIVSSNAPRPSDKNLLKLLEGLKI